MALDLGQLFAGRLVYAEPVTALDDVRFDRIIKGFADHYVVSQESETRFSFARGEGYNRAGRFDAFGLADSGSVERLRNAAPLTDLPGGNVVLMPPRYHGIRFVLTVRVVLVFWLLTLFSAWLYFRGDWMPWLIAYVAATIFTVVAIRRSLKAKLRLWLAKESWN
jgi:hypothetical protein